MKWLAALACAGTLAAAGAPRIFYSRSFPGSEPAYLQVTVTSDGAAEYREAPDDDNPLAFQLTPAESAEVFGLAEKLGDFDHPIESAAKVAFTGDKILRYEDGARKNEIKFNFTEDPSGRAIADWFERMAESARDRIELERTAKYDKIGVLDAILRIEVALGRKRLVAMDQFLPMLDRVANNESYMNAARTRAAKVAAEIRDPKP
ncbi:MAG TPA: hypothetical protein VMU19_15115 [Bryobacteraceae bacterium]|nr:hypothetical protein [Bryobacteraceae bacterium]